MTKIYTVIQTLRTPAYDERNGLTWDVTATTRAEAIKKARSLARDFGYSGIGYAGSFKVVGETIADSWT